MHTITKRVASALLTLLTAVAGLAAPASPVLAAPVTINLCAVAGTATLTGAVTVPIWGFGIPSTPGNCGTATAGLPGPNLVVNAGDVVTINVTNALPAGHTLSFEIPGVSFNPGPTDGSALITFTAGAPGAYLYQSGGDAGRQEAMGLYGAFIVRSLTAGQAYDTATTQYDTEAILVLSQVDPAFNGCATDPNPPCTSNPNNFDMKNYLATYWLINGKAYPATTPIVAVAGQRVLLRYLNAGYDNTTMALLGMHQRVVARDARLLNNPFFASAETIPAGATEDAIVTVPAGAPPSANGFALYNRQLHVTNGAGITYSTPGGMMTFIRP